jgi:hypothetical protein
VHKPRIVVFRAEGFLPASGRISEEVIVRQQENGIFCGNAFNKTNTQSEGNSNQ